MEAVLGLLVMLLGVSHGVETSCDGRQDGAQCYGALGGTVDIQLMDRDSEIPRYQLQRNKSNILRGTKDKILINNIEHRSVFFPSKGTFRINNLSSTDSSKYSFQTFDSDGKTSGVWTLQLFVQAPVSSVLLVSECLSQGEMRVSCSSEGGDSPQYSWTLDGRTLTDAELLCGNNESNIITLKQHVSGHLVCSVRNNVSNVFKEQRISTCGFIFINCTSVNGTQISGWVHEDNNTLCTEPTTELTAITGSIVDKLPLIGGVLSALVMFLVVGMAVTYAQRKKQNKPKEEEYEQEVTFTDVRMIKQQENQVEQRTEVEVEVEYGQIKFSKRSLQTEPTGDDCLYASVQKVK